MLLPNSSERTWEGDCRREPKLHDLTQRRQDAKENKKSPEMEPQMKRKETKVRIDIPCRICDKECTSGDWSKVGAAREADLDSSLNPRAGKGI